MEEREIQTKVAILEKDMSRVSLIIDKLDATIDKLSDFSSSIKELLAVHDHKLQVQLDVNNEIYSIIKDLKEENHRDHQETKEQIKFLTRRLDAIERWKYTVVGAALVVGFFLSKFSTNIGFT